MYLPFKKIRPFWNNVADGMAGSGGGILNDAGATLNISNSTISGNTSVRAGGGIEDNSGAGTTVVLTNVTLDGNTTASSPGNGGGIHITGAGDMEITGGVVSNNTASAEGGGLWNGTGIMSISGVNISANTASGGAMPTKVAVGCSMLVDQFLFTATRSFPITSPMAWLEAVAVS
ncbi:MAG: hypothetical protein R2825_21915 [Saprospiraceae bacterium]